MPLARSTVAKPSPEELSKLLASPTVKIYVGTKPDPYLVPVDLLRHSSPYFTACFRPNTFHEGIDGVLTLREDRSEFFEIFLAYVRQEEDVKLDLSSLEEGLERLNICWEFIEFCDKYDICEAASIVAEDIEANLPGFERLLVLSCPSSLQGYWGYLEEFMDFAFDRLHVQNLVVTVLCNTLGRWLLEYDWEPLERYIPKLDDEIAEAVMEVFKGETASRDGGRIVPEEYKPTSWTRKSY